MDPRAMITFLGVIEKCKCNTRHSWTSTERRESVAEHSWRLSVMALLCADEYPDLDMQKVLKMCLIHDFGEAVTGDIPSFYKEEADEEREKEAIARLLATLPPHLNTEFSALFAEMDALESPEAKLFKALDNMEAVISHNEAPISTWIPLEYSENLVYGAKAAECSDWTKQLRRLLYEDSVKKMEAAGIPSPTDPA